MGTERRIVGIGPVRGAPIACTLDGAETDGRLEEWRGLLAHALEPPETTVSGARVRLAGGDAVEQEARRLIEAESACCGFFSISLARAGDALVLEVEAPEQGRPLAEALLGLSPRD